MSSSQLDRVCRAKGPKACELVVKLSSHYSENVEATYAICLNRRITTSTRAGV